VYKRQLIAIFCLRSLSYLVGLLDTLGCSSLLLCLTKVLSTYLSIFFSIADKSVFESSIARLCLLRIGLAFSLEIRSSLLKISWLLGLLVKILGALICWLDLGLFATYKVSFDGFTLRCLIDLPLGSSDA
jgi:hypothetical protein